MAKRKRSKYGVDITAKGRAKRTYNGITYDSLLELQFLKEYIEPRITSGEIKSYKRQISYTLVDGFTNCFGNRVQPVKYKSDFDVSYATGETIIYDVKGKPDATSLIKRKLFWSRYPDKKLVFICRSVRDGGWLPYDELKKIRAERKKKNDL